MQRTIKLLLVLCALSWLSACAPTRYPPSYHAPKTVDSMLGEGGYIKTGNPYNIDGKTYYPLESGDQYDQTGIGSWYGKEFHGKKTANGEIYDMYALTAAHTVLPMPSMVLVTNLDNGKSIKVRINDRGPFVKNRLIDLSYSAAKALGYSEVGTARVRVQTLDTNRNVPVSESSKPKVQEPVVLASVPVPVPVPADKPNQNQMKQAFVQVGAFSEKERAEGVLNDLQPSFDASHPPLRVEAATHVYRVRIGPFDLDKDAEVALERVRSHGYVEAMIIHD